MTLASVGSVYYPHKRMAAETQNYGVGGATQLNATYVRWSLIFQVPVTGTLDTLYYFVDTVTSSAQIRIGLYTVDSSGNPTSTTYGGSAYTTRASVSAATGYTETLGTPASATQGDTVAMVIEWDSSTADIKFGGTGESSVITKLPNAKRYNGSAWSVPGFIPTWAIGYGGTYYDIGNSPFISSPTVYIWNSGSSPSEYALVFPCPVKMRAAGIWALVYQPAAADATALLYTGTTVVATATLDGDVNGSNYGFMYYRFAASYTLDAGTTYYVALKPTTANSIRLYYADVSSAGLLAACGGLSTMCLTSRSGGSWASSTTTRRPMLGLILDQFDDGAGGGGGGAATLINGGLVG